MLIFHYHPATGVYQGQHAEADADPLELELAQKAVREPLVAAAEQAFAEARSLAMRRFAAVETAGRISIEAAESAFSSAVEVHGELLGRSVGEPDEDGIAADNADRPDPQQVAKAAQGVAEARAAVATARSTAAKAIGAAGEVLRSSEVEAKEAFDAAKSHADEAAAAVTPAVFLLPAHATFEAPPAVGPGQQARRVDDGWLVEAAPDRPDEGALAQEDPAARAKARAAGQIDQVRWMVDRHRDQVDLGGPTTFSAARYVQLLEYIQALREVSDQPGFPESIEWPVLPTASSE